MNLDDVTMLLTDWIIGFRADSLRFLAFAFSVWFILWVLLAPFNKAQKIRPGSPSLRQMAVECVVSMRSVVFVSTFGLIPYELAKAGWLPGVKLAESWGTPWFILSVILITLGHDTWFYWCHRLIHQPRLFRSFHRRHHKSRDPSPFASFSFDIGEAVLNAAFVPLWMIIVPTSWGVIGVFFLHMLMRNLLAHAGYQLLPAGPDGKPLFDWVTTVTHHDMHHEHGGYNFGLYFTFWDRRMGTENPEYLERFRQAARPWPLAVLRRRAPGPAPVNETEG